MTPESLPGLTEPILLLVLICSDDHPRLLCSATLAAIAPPAEAKQLHAFMARAAIVLSPEWPAVPQRPTKRLVNGAGFLEVGLVTSIPRLESPEPLHTSLPPILDVDCFQRHCLHRDHWNMNVFGPDSRGLGPHSASKQSRKKTWNSWLSRRFQKQIIIMPVKLSF